MYIICKSIILDSIINLPLYLKARTIFEKATKVIYKQVDDLAAIWCEYGEMELRHENYDQALRILRVRYKPPHVSMSVLVAFFPD